MLFRFVWVILAQFVLQPAFAQDHQPIKIGLLRFGTVAWEIDALRHEGLDHKHGIAIIPVEFASNEAAKVSLQTGAVDMIVVD
ncbi:hypothetical protein C4E04_00970 [Microvirga sp. 17 mud 1-3]|nr:hypothetical protein C4E04_00970 [Microvirga sp. 17 mud 1-3]